MKERRVSVIVPVYNTAPYLERCLDSVLAQSHASLEIILVDDGSTDDSSLICDKYAETDTRVSVIHTPNRGLSEARNKGIEISASEYIQFVDSDDLILPDMTDRLLHVMEETGSDIVQCEIQEFHSLSDIKYSFEKDFAIRTVHGDDCLRLIVSDYYPTVLQFNKLFRRSIFSTLRFPSGKYHEDEFLIHHELAAAGSVSVINDPYYCYFKNPGGITGTITAEKRLDGIEAYVERLRYFASAGHLALCRKTFLTFIKLTKRLEFEYPLHDLSEENRKRFHELKAEAKKITDLYFPWEDP